MTATEDHDPLLQWVTALDRDTLHALILQGAQAVPQYGDWLNGRRALGADDPAELLGVVNDVLTPYKRFYYYREAMDYAVEAADLVGLLEAASESGSAGLLKVIERALTLVTRAILRSDDSSGMQGELIAQLLESHARAARTANPPLTQGEQTRLVNWLVKYRYGGTQDLFDPDIVDYAPILSPTSIERYRAAILRLSLDSYQRFPLSRLAVLDKDKDAIIAAWGDGLANARVAARVVADLREAGLHQAAVEHAYKALPGESHFSFDLVDFLTQDALDRGHIEAAVDLRLQRFEKEPSSTAFARLKETATAVGLWERERETSEERLREVSFSSYLRHLLGEGRGEEAWNAANASDAPKGDVDTWLSLCEHRAPSHPAETLPVYEEIVREILQPTHKKNYRWAAKVLKQMRAVAQAAGEEARFAEFLAAIREENRRRTTCIEIFDRAGLT